MGMRIAALFITALLFAGCQAKPHEEKQMNHSTVAVETNQGMIEIELFDDEAPITVKNFLRYVDENYYDGTIFHRVIDGFMIQGGGFTANMEQKTTHGPIRNEADNKLSNLRGTIAMARTSEIHSATAQFFINVADNVFLDYRNPAPSAFGYCVFGKVISGMDVVDKIKKVKTGLKGGHENVPVESIKIIKIAQKK